MDWFEIIIVYMLSWWLVLFMVLPFGVTHKAPQDDGQQPGAPDKPNLAKKLLITTVIAIPVMVVVQLLVYSGLFNVR
tara:strand:- start:94 stop:324 length:231 start_codon:yes stop_codon:yes gene_type:complete